jgi:hypothetical protein
MKTGNTIYKLRFNDTGDEHFFGSLSAIFVTFSSDQIGVKLTSLWSNANFNENGEYNNPLVSITKSVLIRKKGNRGRAAKQV